MTPSNVSAEERVEHTPRISDWLRAESQKLAQQAAARREMASVMTNSTLAELLEGKAMAELLSGRKIEEEASLKAAKADAAMQNSVASKLERKAEQLAEFADSHEALVSALRDLLSAEKLDDGDPILENARAKADAILKSVSPKEKAIK